MLQKRYFTQSLRRIVLYVLLFSNGLAFSQMEILQRTDLALFEEAEWLYEQRIFGLARVYYTDYLTIPAANRASDWISNEGRARLRSALCGLWLEEDEAEYILSSLIDNYRPHIMAYEAALEVGNKYYDEKKYRDAISYYALVDMDRINPDMKSEIAFKRGYAHFVKKQFDHAANYLTQASAFRTVYFYPANYYLGMIEFFDENYDHAAQYFEKVQGSKKYKAYLPYYLTQIYFNQGDYSRVVKYGEAQIANLEVEKEIEIKNLLGRSYFELGDDIRALKYLREVENSSKKLASSDHYQIGYLAYKEEAYEEAIEHLKIVSSSNHSNDVQANYYLGHAYLALNKKEAARSAFANVKRRSKDDKLRDEATYNYGLLSAELGHDREAVNALLSIPATSSYYVISQEALAKLFLNTSDYDNALKILEPLDKHTPILKEAFQKVTFLKGKQLLNKKQYTQAISLFNTSLKYPVNPEIHSQALFAKGLAQHESSRYSASTTTLNAYQTLNFKGQNESKYLSSYVQGYNYFKQKKYVDAKIQFTRAVADIDEDFNSISNSYIKTNILSDALLRQADCAFHANNYDAAKSSYERVYSMHKSGAVYAYFQTGIIYGLKGDPIQKIVILEDLQKKYTDASLADDALLEASRTYLDLAKYDDAAKPLLLLTESYPHSDLLTQAYLALGLISYNKGATTQAIKFYKSIFNYNPSPEERQDALRALQEIYVQDLKDIDEYVAFVEGVSGGKITNTERDSLHYRSAYNSYANADYNEAQVALQKYITNFPNGLYTLEAHYFRGECAAIEKDYSNAFRDYTFVVDQGPGKYYEKALRKAALIAYNELANYKQSLAYFKNLATLPVQEVVKIEAILGAMRSSHQLGFDKQTIKYAKLVQEHELSSIQNKLAADYHMAKIFYKSKKFDDALLSLNRISKNSNDNFAAEARYLIADIYKQKNELDIAEEMSRLAIKENANYPYYVARSIILLADILIMRDDAFNAKAALEAVIENFTEDASLLEEAKRKLDKIRSIENTTADENNDNSSIEFEEE